MKRWKRKKFYGENGFEEEKKEMKRNERVKKNEKMEEERLFWRGNEFEEK